MTHNTGSFMMNFTLNTTKYPIIIKETPSSFLKTIKLKRIKMILLLNYCHQSILKFMSIKIQCNVDGIPRFTVRLYCSPTVPIPLNLNFWQTKGLYIGRMFRELEVNL